MKNYLQKHTKELYTNNWSTPKYIYNHFMNLGYIDPNPLFSTIDPDTYDNGNKLFINPPYERGIIDKFIDMAIRLHSKYNKEIVILIPARTDTYYFHKLLNYGCSIYFIKGRLKFGDSKQSAPFPSVIIKLTSNENKNTFNILNL